MRRCYIPEAKMNKFYRMPVRFKGKINKWNKHQNDVQMKPFSRKLGIHYTYLFY